MRGVNKDGLLWGACELPPGLSCSYPVCMTPLLMHYNMHAAFIACKPSAQELALRWLSASFELSCLVPLFMLQLGA